MPKIPTYEAPIRTTFQGVRGDALVAGLEAQHGFALGLMALSKQMLDARRADEVSLYTSQAMKDLGELRLSFETDPDYKSFPERYEERAMEIKDRYAGQIKDPIVKQHFHRAYTEAASTMALDVKGIAIRKEIDAQRANLTITLDNYLGMLTEAGDREAQYLTAKAQGAIQAKAAAGVITEQHAANLTRSFLEGAGRAKVARDKVVDQREAMEAFRVLGYEGAVRWLNDPANTPALMPSERATLAAAMSREEGLRLGREKEERDEAIRQTQDAFIAALRTNTLTEADILRSPLEPTGTGSKDFFLKALDARAKAAIDKKKDPLNVTDPKIYAGWSYRINTEPDTIVEASQIYGDVGKGLSTKDAEKLVNLWRSNRTKPKELEDPLKSQRAKRYHSILKRLATDNIFDDDDRENELIYGKKASLLDDYFITHPKATDPEVEKFFEDLAKPEMEAWYVRLWNKIFPPEKPEPETPGIPHELEAGLREDAIEVLRRNGLALTEENIVKVMERLEQ